MTNIYMSELLRRQIQDRANDRCEYCGKPRALASHSFHIDHVIARKHHGATTLDNLAWACYNCNLFKGSDVASYDLEPWALTPLYNPRTQAWVDHFQLMATGIMVGKTPVGRVTVYILQLNLPDHVESRYVLLQANLW